MATKSICIVDGCGKPARGHGYCQAHYHRWRTHGDPLAGRTPEGEPLKFFLAALASDTDDCILWPYGRHRKGYAVLSLNGKSGTAHRAICLEKHGPPPSPDHEAAHSCLNGQNGCINPNHLRWATPQENADDVLTHGRRQMGETAHMAKLTEADVLSIRRLAATHTEVELGRKFGVSASAISLIKSRKNWKHVK